MYSIEVPDARGKQDENVLLATAFESIEHGLLTGEPLAVDTRAHGPALCAARASFVTLDLAGELRGCIGSLIAKRALIEDVAHNAFAAAFSDPRFPPLCRIELDHLELHIALLTPPQALSFDSPAALIKQLRPYQDGLVLEAEGRRATFLPVVWQTLPEPEHFLRQLKLKAGLPADYWSETLRVSRYTTRSITGRHQEQR